PVLIPPRLDRVSVQNSPDRAGTDGSAKRGRGTGCEICRRQSAQGKLGLADSLTGDGFDDGLVARGKNRAFARVPPYRPKRSRLGPGDAARGAPSWGETPGRPPPRRWTRLGFRRAGAPIAPVGAGQARRFADGGDRDTGRGTQRDTSVDRKVRGR